jgi:hypothetical protein
LKAVRSHNGLISLINELRFNFEEVIVMKIEVEKLIKLLNSEKKFLSLEDRKIASLEINVFLS